MFEFVAVGALVMLAVGVTGLLVTGVVHVTVTADARRRHGPPSTRRPSDDGDRGLGTVDDSVADRAEEQPLEGASAPRAFSRSDLREGGVRSRRRPLRKEEELAMMASSFFVEARGIAPRSGGAPRAPLRAYPTI